MPKSLQTPWYNKTIDNLQLAGMSESTQESHARAVRMLIEHFEKDPYTCLPREIRWLSASKVWSGYRGTAGKSRHGVTNRENKHRPEAGAGDRRCHDRRAGQSDSRGNAPRRAACTSLVQHRVGRA